jgi:hypothetical protein
MEQYKFLITKISEKIKDTKQKKYIKDNLEEIVLNLKGFSTFFSSIVEIALSESDIKNKIESLSKLKFNKSKLSKKEANDVLRALNLDNIVGGGEKDKEIAALRDIHNNLDKNVTFCLTNMGVIASKMFSNFPKYGLLMVSKVFSDIANLYNFDWHSFEDFTKKMDWVYLYLFVMASLPVVGAFFDIIIIIRSIKQDRIFLALLTFITTVISMFTFHMVDLGAIIKILYFLDVTSYTSVKNMDIPVLTEGDKDVFYNNDGRTVEIPTTKGNIKDLNDLYTTVEKARITDIPTQEDKEDNLNNMQNEIREQNGGTKINYPEGIFDDISSIDSNMSL